MIDELPKQIIKGIDREFYLLSLYVALTLPDIGGAIEYGSKTNNSERYKKWFNKYAVPRFNKFGGNNLSEETCWRIRCSLLHQGISNHDFLDIEVPTNYFYSGILRNGETLKIDIKIFCKNMAYAFYDWIEEVEETDNFKKEAEKVAKVYKAIFKIK